MMFLRTRAQRLAGVAIAAVVLAIGAGFWVLGPPSAVRARRLDVQRVDDLRQWSRAIHDYWSNHQQLPPTLEEARSQNTWGPIRMTDPETGQPYRYAVTGAVTYELCAEFTGPSEHVDPSSIWSHGGGLTCFSFEARAAR